LQPLLDAGGGIIVEGAREGVLAGRYIFFKVVCGGIDDIFIQFVPISIQPFGHELIQRAPLKLSPGLHPLLDTGGGILRGGREKFSTTSKFKSYETG
jgi:hypothetical protein